MHLFYVMTGIHANLAVPPADQHNQELILSNNELSKPSFFAEKTQGNAWQNFALLTCRNDN